MKALWLDIRYGLRMFRKSPAFTAVAVVALALGIGANTAIFSVINSVLLRPLPFAESERLVRVGGHGERQKGEEVTTFSPQDFYDWRERNTVFESIAAYDETFPSLTGAGEPERLRGARVTADFFRVLRARPALGRDFLPQEEQRDNRFVAVLSHELWQRRFASDPGVVNRTVNLGGQDFTVVGVMPADFDAPLFSGADAAPIQIWVPFAPDLSQWTRSGRSVDGAVARLKPNVTVEQARGEMEQIARQLQQQYPETNAGSGAAVVGWQEQRVARIRPVLFMLLVAVGFVLLIACANVANLLLARAAVRQKEIAIRTALGASRLRVVRQLLTESLMLSLLGATLGLLLALWTTDLLRSLGAGAIPAVAGGVALDTRVLLFTLGVSLLTGVVFGLAPALGASRPDLNETLKETGRSSTAGVGRRRARNLLVVSEIALSLVLLVGAGLLIKSALRLSEVNPGFDPHNVLTMSVFLPGTKYPEDQQQVNFFNRVTERVGALPGVEAVGVTSNLPVSGNYDRIGFYVEGQPEPAREDVPEVERYMVDPGYFRALGITLRAGRVFGPEDRADVALVAVINETAARSLFNGENPVGRRIRTDPERPWREVVGVVGDVRHYDLETPANPQLYLPVEQNPSQAMTVVIRSGNDPAGQVAAARAQVWEVDKDQPVYDVRTMEEWLANSTAQRRFNMTLLAAFAALALALAVVGLYAVMSYTVEQRTHEIGVRMALGAQGGDVLRMVVGQGMALALAGIGVGAACAFALTRAMQSLLFGVSASDPVTFAAVALLLAAVALLACLVPARRAARISPMTALRYE